MRGLIFLFSVFAAALLAGCGVQEGRSLQSAEEFECDLVVNQALDRERERWVVMDKSEQEALILSDPGFSQATSDCEVRVAQEIGKARKRWFLADVLEEKAFLVPSEDDNITL